MESKLFTHHRSYVFRLVVVFFAWLLIISAAPAAEFLVFDVVGDSVSAGTNPDFDDSYGWVHMLLGEGGGAFPDPPAETIFSLWPGITAHNSAVSGSLAVEWAAPDSDELGTVLDHKPDLVVVMIGANDFLASFADGSLSDTERDVLREAVEEIIDQLQALSPPPAIIIPNYYDFFDGFSENLPFPYDIYEDYSAGVVEGVAILEQITAVRGCHIVDVYSAFLHHGYGRDLDDPNPLEPPYLDMPLFFDFDIHPVTAGHRRIYELVLEKMAELKGPPELTGWMMR